MSQDINFLEVDSSNIAAIGYDAESSVLVVKFKNGTAYQYEDVPEEKYQEFVKAESKGAYFAKSIRSLKGRKVP